MRKILFNIFCLLTAIGHCQPPVYAWSDRMGADSSDIARAMTTDNAGNVYTTGSCAGTVDFDPGPGTYTLSPSAGTNNPWVPDIYISKMDPSGNLLWATRMGGGVPSVFASYGVSISADGSGNVITTGMFMGTVDFDPGPGIYNLSSTTGSSIFILKLDGNGNFVWAKRIGGTGQTTVMSSVLDPSGNFFATGFYRGTIDMDPGPGADSLTTSFGNPYNTFILKLDAMGNFVFAKQLRTTGPLGTFVFGVTGSAICLDVFGNIYNTGIFTETIDFDPGPGSYNLTPTITARYVLKLDATGNFLWAGQFSRTTGIPDGFLVAGGNALYITGTFYDTGDFDPGTGSYTMAATGTPLNPILPHNQFILKLDMAGNFVWAKSLSSTIDSYGTAITLDAASNIYAVGTFEGSADFDPGPGTYNIASNGGADGFILTLDASGNFLRAETVGGALDDWMAAISVDPAKNLYACGYFRSTTDFDPGTGVANLSSAGKEDIFILKWSQCAAASPPVDLTPPQNKIICANTAAILFAYASNPIEWFASLTSTLSLGTGSNYVTPVLSIGNYTYFAADPLCANFARTAITLTVDACLGLKALEESKTQIVVYPVPSADGLITVDVGIINENMVLTVQNILGERIYEKKIFTNPCSLDLSANTSGIYTVKLTRNNQPVAINKIIIQ